MDSGSLLKVEQQRLELEANISKLRKSLQHWQTWEIEYEGLREEIASLPQGSSTEDILSIARGFRAELVDDNELQSILGQGKGSIRDQRQVVDILAKRVDYVSKNAHVIKKQLSDAQKRRNALLLAEEPDYREDAGLPLTDITEELDEDGNVLSSKVQTPGSAAPQLVDILKKAGVKDVIEQGGVVTTSEKPKHDQAVQRHANTHDSTSSHPEAANADTESKSAPVTGQEEYRPHGDLRKSQDAGTVHETTISDSTPVVNLASTNKKELYPAAKNVPTDPVAGPRDTQEDDGEKPVVRSNPDDTPEEAALRSDMLQYGLGEVGAIVAELDMEENASEVSFDDDQAALSFDSDLDENDIDDEDSEDENGMVKHPTMSRKYVEKMKELEQKHGIRALQNLGPDASKLPREVQKELDRPSAAEAARKAALARESETRDEATADSTGTRRDLSKPKKKVAFAEDLDIAPESEAPLSTPESARRPQPLSLNEPVKDAVIERQTSTTGAVEPTSLSETKSKKLSRFKATREATPQTPLLPPSPLSQSPEQQPEMKSQMGSNSKRTHADSIMERDITARPKPPDADDIDEEVHRQQIASEYYKIRNRMIQRQGGFVGGGAAENYGDEVTQLPMVDENGKEKKISRFKAARLK
jgi:unconventional prefoldin RPB5 interactor 1